MMDRHAVRRMLSVGMTNGEVARPFGISVRTVRPIRIEGSVKDGETGGRARSGKWAVVGSVSRPRSGSGP